VSLSLIRDAKIPFLICLCALLASSFPALAVAQEQGLPKDTWLIRAQSLTDDLLNDTVRLDTYDRVLVWGRLGDIWWRDDPERARSWFVKGIEILESSTREDKTAISCRLATTRTLLSIIVVRDRGLSKRLMSILKENTDKQNIDQRRENATALADAALAVLSSDPQAAEKLGEASLRLGVSIRLGILLWRLRARDQQAADALFSEALRVARVAPEFNLFSILISAVSQGPFSATSYQKDVLNATAEAILRQTRAPFDDAAVCRLGSLVAPLLPSFDLLPPDQSQRVRSKLALCQRSSPQESGQPDKDSTGDKNPLTKAPVTIEELLKAASEATDQNEHDIYLLKAAEQAAKEKNFDRAISILDSINDDGRKRLDDSWWSRRWSYASSSACVYLKSDNQSSLMKVTEATPSNLRAFVSISLAMNCTNGIDSVKVLELLEAGRKELEKATVSQQVVWYLTLVQLYTKLSPSAAPDILSQAIAAVNRRRQEKTDDCTSDQSFSFVLSNEIVLSAYKLPTALLETDEFGVRYALGSIQPADVRVAMRLDLLKGTLEQRRSTLKKATITEKKTPND
jgi:hypothetical protein